MAVANALMNLSTGSRQPTPSGPGATVSDTSGPSMSTTTRQPNEGVLIGKLHHHLELNINKFVWISQADGNLEQIRSIFRSMLIVDCDATLEGEPSTLSAQAYCATRETVIQHLDRKITENIISIAM